MKQVGIVGSTGAVGQELLHVLYNRNFPVDVSTLYLFGSDRSTGKIMETPFGKKEVESFSVEKTRDLDIVFLAVSGDFSRQHARKIARGKTRVIDNSSAFRMDPGVPLICPEVNGHEVRDAKLIANPNCTTAILAVALFPLHQNFVVNTCIVSTYQATSGAGTEAMTELREQSKNYLTGKSVQHEKFQYPIPFNLIPHIDTFQENGYTREEMKVVWETRKIFHEPDFQISCTAVRIPTFRAHAESVTIRTQQEISPTAARNTLSSASGIRVVDDLEKNQYPMPLTATKQYDVEVGRIRRNLIFGKHGLDFFICGDQLLKGAALNAVQIAELLV